MNLWVILWKYKTVKTNAYWHIISGCYTNKEGAKEIVKNFQDKHPQRNYKLCKLEEVKTDGKEKS